MQILAGSSSLSPGTAFGRETGSNVCPWGIFADSARGLGCCGGTGECLGPEGSEHIHLSLFGGRSLSNLSLGVSEAEPWVGAATVSLCCRGPCGMGCLCRGVSPPSCLQLSEAQAACEAARKASQQLRRRCRRLVCELEDARVLTESQQSRSHELEKRQKK